MKQFEFVLFFLLGIVCSRGDSRIGIGQGYYLPALSLIQDNGYGRTVFDTIPDDCIKKAPSPITKVAKKTYESTESFYKKLGMEISLDGEILAGFTLGKTVLDASYFIDSKTISVKGSSLEIYATTGYWEFIPDCIRDGKLVQLDTDFQTMFEDLPADITNPSISGGWYKYHEFLQNYGSHVTTRVNHGSKLIQYVFSKSTEEISSRDLLIKVCAPLRFLKLPDVLSFCGEFTDKDYKRVATLTTGDVKTIRGGTAETRAKLWTNMTDSLVEKFLAEASMADQPISYHYMSVWDLLKTRYMGTTHFKKASNLEAYYLGFLNTGCALSTDVVPLRRFILVKDDPHSPQYQCQLAPIGCRKDSDCHIGSIGLMCFCYGESCVEKREVNDPLHTLKEERYRKLKNSGSHDEGSNLSCDYQKDVTCSCKQDFFGDWKKVWPTGNEPGPRPPDGAAGTLLSAGLMTLSLGLSVLCYGV